MTLKTRDIEKSLLKKGFKRHDNDHKYFIFVYNGEKEKKVMTKISHSHTEISDSLISMMSQQLHTSKDFFIGFIDCTKRESDYIKTLIDKDIIIDSEVKKTSE